MNRWPGFICFAVISMVVGAACAQTAKPTLGNIETPYAPIQSQVTVAGSTWGAGAVAYGPAGTPLVLTGSALGGGGTVQFVPYARQCLGQVQPNSEQCVAGTVQATVTLWTSNMLIFTVPSGAYPGLVTVTVDGITSNGLPFLVTPGAYSASCPAGPTGTQLQITTASLHDGAVNQSYSATLGATGGAQAYTWSVANGTLPAGLSLNASTGTISGTPTAATGFNPSPITFQVSDNSSPHQTDQAEISITIESQPMHSGTIYSYNAGYDMASNATYFQDWTYSGGSGVMGNWTYTYDSLNRLATATATWPDGTPQYACWSYDSFGNRLQQEISSASFVVPSGGGNVCNAQSAAGLETDINSFVVNGSDPGTNRVQSTNARGIAAIPTYDAAGNLLNDGVNQYLYDGDGRICAVQNTMLGTTIVTGYIYDSDGNRVAKGAIPVGYVNSVGGFTSIGCDPTNWTGFKFSEDYVLGMDDEELTTLDGDNNWQRTNVFVAGRLIGTYDLVPSPTNPAVQVPSLHFQLEDSLGTRRMQVSGMFANLGQPETDFQSLPFGDQFATFQDPYAGPTADDAAPLHFTGKERDAESGNDYFGARYYASTMGRFMSPDWSAKAEPVPYAKLDDPQSLNLYAYVRNNPLTRVDLDGHCGGYNPQTGQMYCPDDLKNPVWASVPQTFKLPNDPSGLGPEWTQDTGHKNPNGSKWKNPDGWDLEFHKGQKGARGNRGKDHWHLTPPGAKEKDDEHLAPGTEVTVTVPDPKPDPAPQPAAEPEDSRSAMDRVNDWLNRHLSDDFKDYLRNHPYGPLSGPGPAPAASPIWDW